jgi:UTP--glucose-1-phosphate uridylyltransferase
MVTLMSTMPYHAHLFRGRVFDTGHQLGFLTANIAYALKRPDIGQELRTIIKELM